jgi:hypothetical protein
MGMHQWWESDDVANDFDVSRWGHTSRSGRLCHLRKYILDEKY